MTIRKIELVKHNVSRFLPFSYIKQKKDKDKTKRLLDILSKPIYFTLEELITIQSSNDPFTSKEIYCIMWDELNRKNPEEINYDVVDYCMDILEFSN